MVPYTLITGSKNFSSWSLRGYLAIRASGAPFKEIVVELLTEDSTADKPVYSPAGKAEILRHSPAGKIPVLKIHLAGKTLTVWDSLAICETLAERHPEAQMWPDDADMRAMARAYAAEMHAGFPQMRQRMGMDLCHTHPTPKMDPALQGEIDRLFFTWREALALSGGPFLFGRASIADIMYAPMTFRLTGYSIALPPDIAAYVHQLQCQPAVQDWLNDARKEEECPL